MRRFRHLAGPHRTPATNRLLGGLLAFNAGAVNAGGFLVAQMYTSHMTGFVSMVGDHLVLGNATLVLGALGVLLAFVSGAATTALIVNFARMHHLRSAFALPLLLLALLMLLFGVIGAALTARQTPFTVPLTVLMLAFSMGLQNAMVTKMSSAQIRTTHMTGVITDLGIELGKALYWNRAGRPLASQVRANRVKMRIYGALLGLFMLGGLVGAAGFKHIGFAWTIPLASLLLAICAPHLLDDARRAWRWYRHPDLRPRRA